MTNPRNRAPAEEPTGTTLFSAIRRVVSIGGGLGLALTVIGAAAVLLGVVLVLFIPELRGAGYLVIIIGSFLFLGTLLISFQAVWESLTGRRGRYGSNTLVMIVTFIALAVLVFVVVERNTVRWDTTATQQFSLAPQTLEILGGLAEPVEAIAFFVPGDPSQEPFRLLAENQLNEFQHRSDGSFSYRFIDPDRNLAVATRYGVTQYPTIVFAGLDSGRIYRLTAPLFEERDFTSALLISTGVERKRVYYITGHGERTFQDVAPDSHQGFGFAVTGLATDNYEVLTLSLSQNPEVLQDLEGADFPTALIIAGPQQDLPEAHSQLIHQYLRDGGRLLLLLEPDSPESFIDLMGKWGVAVDKGSIVDLASHVSPEPLTPLITRAQYDPFQLAQPAVIVITGPLDETYFPGATALAPFYPPEEMPPTIRPFALAGTTLLSCMTADPQVTTCPEGDFGRVYVPAMAVQAVAPLNEAPNPDAPRETRIVVFGDTDFATNFHLNSVSNRDLLLNSVNWLTEDISLASVRPKAVTFRRLVVTTREMQLIRGMGWLVLPLVMTVLAGVTWWRRR